MFFNKKQCFSCLFGTKMCQKWLETVRNMKIRCKNMSCSLHFIIILHLPVSTGSCCNSVRILSCRCYCRYVVTYFVMVLVTFVNKNCWFCVKSNIKVTKRFKKGVFMCFYYFLLLLCKTLKHVSHSLLKSNTFYVGCICWA